MCKFTGFSVTFGCLLFKISFVKLIDWVAILNWHHPFKLDFYEDVGSVANSYLRDRDL